jgi:formylglycine-generating enzyme required for sulfatase activity
MMQKATRYHAVWALVLAVVLALLGWGAYEGHGTLKAHALQERLLGANINDVPTIVQDMAPYRRWLDRLLHEAYAQAEKDHDRRRQLHTSRELAPQKAGVGQHKSPGWYVNGQGQTFVTFPDPVEFVMGSRRTEEGREGRAQNALETLHKRRIGRSFALAREEVTVEQFLRFRKNHSYNPQYAPTADSPINLVTWYDAAAYCNWLSKQENIPKEQWCYEPNEQGQYAEKMKVKPNFLELEGYRLPTEAEWEYAARAGAVTARYYGETKELLHEYAWYAENSLDRGMLPVGSRLKPNDWGLFDLYGNAMEWCHDRARYFPLGRAGKAAEDKGYKEDILGRFRRVLRGGSFLDLAVDVRSAYRFWGVPTYYFYSVGFRPARTFTP